MFKYQGFLPFLCLIKELMRKTVCKTSAWHVQQLRICAKMQWTHIKIQKLLDDIRNDSDVFAKKY